MIAVIIRPSTSKLASEPYSDASKHTAVRLNYADKKKNTYSRYSHGTDTQETSFEEQSRDCRRMELSGVNHQLITTTNECKPRRIIMPYIKQISEMTARLLRPHGVTIAHKPMGTLRQIVSKPKPINKLEEKNNVIYQIQCNDCSAKYVGQTGRKLATRLHEHQLAIKRHDRLSLISVHEDNEGHHFNFNTVKILDRANNKRTREFLEAWHSTENSINKHVELDRTYFPLRMNDLKKSSKKRNPSSRRSQPAGERR